jgi:hypothetical protein
MATPMTSLFLSTHIIPDVMVQDGEFTQTLRDILEYIFIGMEIARRVSCNQERELIYSYTQSLIEELLPVEYREFETQFNVFLDRQAFLFP